MEKLQRQRALLHEHLRWLDSEIAAEASTVPATKAPAPAPPATPVSPTTESSSVATIEAPAAVEIPEADVRGIHNEVRSGCLLYFAIAFVVLGLGLAFVYLRY